MLSHIFNTKGLLELILLNKADPLLRFDKVSSFKRIEASLDVFSRPILDQATQDWDLLLRENGCGDGCPDWVKILDGWHDFLSV